MAAVKRFHRRPTPKPQSARACNVFFEIERDVTLAPLVGGNKVLLLQNGPAAYNAMFAAMRSASNSINLETFIFTDDEVGQQFASLLIDARRRGVVVNVIYDSFGSKDTSSKFFEGLRQAGVSVVEFNPINPFEARHWWSVKHRDHRKLLIIDGKTAFTGGINITADYEKGLSGGPRSQSRAGDVARYRRRDRRPGSG